MSEKILKKFLIFLVLSVISSTQSIYAQEKQCWRGTIEIVRTVQHEDIKKKEDNPNAGHGEDVFKYKEDIHITVGFYLEPGKPALIEGKDISGSFHSQLKSFWESAAATCRKRVKAGYMPRDVTVTPGNSERKEIIDIANLFEQDLKFSASANINPNTKEYSFMFGIIGLLLKGNHTYKATYSSVKKNCERTTREEDLGSGKFESPYKKGFGGRYSGHAISLDRFSGSKTVADPEGKLAVEQVPIPIGSGLKFETTFKWDVERVPCECSAKATCQRAQHWHECALQQISSIFALIVQGRGMATAENANYQARGIAEFPGYSQLTGAFLSLEQGIIALQTSITVNQAQRQGECVQLPRPEDEKECQRVAKRVEEGLKKIQETLRQGIETEMIKFEGITTVTSGSTARSTVLAGLQATLAQLQLCQ